MLKRGNSFILHAVIGWESGSVAPNDHPVSDYTLALAIVQARKLTEGIDVLVEALDYKLQ
ncbi:MAG: hypothetical protein WCI23_04055 [Chlorobiaceae bacterium]